MKWRRGYALAFVALGLPGCRDKADDTAATAPATETAEVAVDPCAPPLDDPVDPDALPLLDLDAPPSNLLMISIDTTRRDAVGRYSGDPTATPFIDQLLASSYALDNHRSCSNWTLPSMLCVLSGRDATRAHDGDYLGQRLVSEGFRAGYVTANTWIPAAWPGSYDYEFVGGVGGVDLSAEAMAAARSFVDSGERWFLHVHYLDPHAPYHPPSSYLGGLADLPRVPWSLWSWEGTQELEAAWPYLSEQQQAEAMAHIQTRYAAELRFIDDVLATLWADLEAAGALDDTLVVLVSDHGEQLFQRGVLQHGDQLYDEENAAVAALWAPGVSGGAWAGPTTHKDLAPTALHALGLSVDEAVMEGLVVGTARPDRPRFTSVVKDVVRQAVEVQSSEGVLRLHYDWRGWVSLYDKRADPGERTDIWDPGDPGHRALYERLLPQVHALDCEVPALSPVLLTFD